MKTIGIIANPTKARAAEVLRRIAVRAKALGLALCADPPTGALLDVGEVAVAENLFDVVDLVMALGGDGTMIRAVRELNGRDKPIIGVNIGGLGFLTSVAEDDLDRAMECLANGSYVLSEHPIVSCRVERGGEKIAEYRALNDVVVNRGATARVVTLDVWVDGGKVTSYVCDGLIVSTPAGSTGHSLSAGGPILAPATRAFVISLICPHTLSSRPLVVPDSSEICVGLHNGERRLILSVDGQVGCALAGEDRVLIRRGERSVRFIHLPGYSYFGVLRQKLHWSGSSVG